MASKLTQYINSKLNEKGFGANPEGIKEAKERGKKHSSIAAAKKAGDLLLLQRKQEIYIIKTLKLGR